MEIKEYRYTNIQEHIKEITEKTNAEKEYLCAAFIKETGLEPSECQIVTQHTMNGFKIWVEKNDKLKTTTTK